MFTVAILSQNVISRMYFSEWEDLDDDDGNHGEFFFHFDLHRQMESMQREMEDMFRNFGAVEFFPGTYKCILPFTYMCI